VIGLVAGFLKALLGIGGGVILVPALVLVSGIAQKEAHAMSLWYVIPTSLLAALLYASRGELAIPLIEVGVMVAAALLGAPLAAPLVKRIKHLHLRQIFGVAVFGMAGIMIWRAFAGDLGPAVGPGAGRYVVLVGTGFAAGFLSTLLGIGGGVVVVPALVLLAGFGQKVAQGMSLAYVVPVALFSALLYRVHIKVRVAPRKVSCLVGGGLLGATVGAELVTRTSNQALGIIFGCALTLIGVILIVSARRALQADAFPE